MRDAVQPGARARRVIATKKNGKVVNSYPADGTTEALDGAFWYDQADEVAAGATTPTLDQVDFPHTPLTNKGLWSADFRASDWLMFLPQGPDSIPVALRLMRW